MVFTLRNHVPPASAMKSLCILHTQCVRVLQTIQRMIIPLNAIDMFVFAMQLRSASCQLAVTFEMRAPLCISKISLSLHRLCAYK
jgi:hypothetical protein